MTISIRAILESEAEQFYHSMISVFGEDAELGIAERRMKNLPPERCFAAFDGKEIVGTSGAFTHQLSVPGGSIGMAGLTVVTVRPTHRRQGILRRMLLEHDRDAAKHGEAVSGLWASQSSIYPRFGYGLAAESYGLQTDAQKLQFEDGTAGDSIQMLSTEDPGEVCRVLMPLYQDYIASHPGAFARTENWWKYRVLHDEVEKRNGASSLRIACVRRNNQMLGYVLYRQKLGMQRGIMEGDVAVVELIALDRQAEASLWHFIAHIDLFPKISYWNAPVHSALPWLVKDRRQVVRHCTDTLWLRILDIPSALRARRYSSDGTLSIAIDGGTQPSQQFELRVNARQAECLPTTSTCQLHMSIQTLSSLYLGTFSVHELVAQGKIAGEASSLDTANAMFYWPTPPYCPEVF